MDRTNACAGFTGSAAGVGGGTGVSLWSNDVNPESCAGRGGAGAGVDLGAGTGADDSLPRVRSSWVNPPLPCPLADEADSGAGGFSATGGLSVDAIRILSSVSSEPSDTPPNTTLWTTGSAAVFAFG